MHSRLIRSYLTLICLLVVHNADGQQMYKIVGGTWLNTFDIRNCNDEEIHDFREINNEYNSVIYDISFHPDGRLYLSGSHYFLIYNIVRDRVEKAVPFSTFGVDDSGLNWFTINEEGKILWSNHQVRPPILRQIDLRHLTAVSVPEEGIIEDRTGFPGIDGQLPDGSYLVQGGSYGDDRDNNIVLWDPVLDEAAYIEFNYPEMVGIGDSHIYFPACGALQLISLGYAGGEVKSRMMIDVESGSVKEVCPEIDQINARASSAHPTDFRRSPLRIDLDGDNSSGHITAGYFDTLTTCQKVVPLMDDVELYICDGVVDYISFRLKYYDDPLLPEERIYSEDFPEQLDHPSPGRYVWRNTYGNDEAKIKEYLRSLRYRADWTDPDEKERVVMTTMHVGEDSTTSWSVFQLETDEVWAGRDTAVAYCPGSGPLELTDYLSPGVRKDGRIEPSLSKGGTVFTPGVDADREYLYILERMDCADTAVLSVESLKAELENTDLDTVTLCPGGRELIGFPPGRYTSIEWWDGSTGDSTWISADGMTDYSVVVAQGDCGIPIPITVLEQEVEGIAGRDTTIGYCGDGSPIDLKQVLSLPEEYSYKISPALSGADGQLIFDPAVDDAGTYELMTGSASCQDTARIVMEEASVQELRIDPVRLCGGSTMRIGLEPRQYDEVRWWNGDTGDSTTISGEESGPFTVEARQEGCIYLGEFQVIVLPEVILPETYPEDRITICEGQSAIIPVAGLDSVSWDGIMYYPGEDIELWQQEEITLRGYQKDCYAEKTISVVETADPSAEFSYAAERCDGQRLMVDLPMDQGEWEFGWEDGTDSGSLVVDIPGRYPFLIRSADCVFVGSIDVVEGGECDEECTVSIPNAISPNGDGINDRLEFFSSCAINITEFRLFDKWGGELYRTESEAATAQIWERIAPGVYTVQITYETDRGVIKTTAGGVMVIK